MILLHPSYKNTKFLLHPKNQTEHAQIKLSLLRTNWALGLNWARSDWINSTEVIEDFLCEIPATCFVLLHSEHKPQSLFTCLLTYLSICLPVCLQPRSSSLLQVRSTTWAALRCTWAVRRWACPHLCWPGKRWVWLQWLILGASRFPVGLTSCFLFGTITVCWSFNGKQNQSKES